MSVADYRLNPDFADADELQRYLSDIARRLVRAENQEALIQAATRNLLEFGLQRIDEGLSPAIAKLDQAAELGFLVATSESPLTLATGEAVFEIVEGAQRDLFKPTPVLTICRSTEGAEDQYAVARLISYDAETGGLVVDVQAISGISGTHDDWVIAASTGLAPAIITLAAQVAADKVAVNVVKGEVDAANMLLQSALLAIESGPVASVNGKTGIIVLNATDIKTASGTRTLEQALNALDGGTFT